MHKSKFLFRMQKSINDNVYGFCELKILSSKKFQKAAFYATKQGKSLLYTQASTWEEVYEIINQKLVINGYKKPLPQVGL